jgi:hypothetical protein
MPCLLSAHRREGEVKDHTSVPDILSTAENLGISGHSTRKFPRSTAFSTGFREARG